MCGSTFLESATAGLVLMLQRLNFTLQGPREKPQCAEPGALRGSFWVSNGRNCLDLCMMIANKDPEGKVCLVQYLQHPRHSWLMLFRHAKNAVRA